MLNAHIHHGVVQSAVLIIVITHRAIQVVILQNPIHRFFPCVAGSDRLCLNLHARCNLRSTSAHQLTIDLRDARIARFDRSKCRMVTHVRMIHAAVENRV
ncbi:hypothetical protein SD51_12705 [Alicyclobacillus tengchongensis]|nr:hypothetical protein SD51_12705 [Alicyclobacillus tengchongensis]